MIKEIQALNIEEYYEEKLAENPNLIDHFSDTYYRKFHKKQKVEENQDKE